LAQLGKSKFMSTAPVARYRGAIQAMDNLNRHTGSVMLNRMRNGESATGDNSDNKTNQTQNANTTKEAEKFQKANNMT